MKIGVSRFGLAAVVGFSLAASAFSATTVQFGITSAGNPGNILSGVYTDPYQGYVEPVNGTPGAGGSAVAAFCDDFTDDVSPPQFWSAFDTDLSALSDNPNNSSSLANSTVYYGDYNGSETLSATQQTTDYIAVAILAMESMQNIGNATVQDQISFALWNVFDTNVLTSDQNAFGCLDPGGSGCGSSGTPNLTAARNYYNNAMSAAATFTSGAAFESAFGYDVQIYTPETNGAVDPYSDTARPQEFITVEASSGNAISMAEPSSLASLSADFLGVGLLSLVFWRRQSRNRSSANL